MSNQPVLPAAGASLPGVPISHDDRERCAEVLLDAVAGRTGLVSAELDTGRGELTLDYDPTVLPAHEADALVTQVGSALDHRFGLCPTKRAGGDCVDCVDALQAGLERRGQQLATLAVQPGRVAVGTGSPPAVRAQVIHSLRQDQTAAAPGRRWPEIDRTRLEVVLTVITGLSVAVAWAGSALGLSDNAQTALYVLAYLAGGYFGVRAGLQELRQGGINVDMLMVLAAIGAALIGYWREGAILLFLFSLSNTLQSYAMGRSRRAIEALMKLRPQEARVKRGGGEILVRVENLRLGDVVIVRPGDRLPVDGVVAFGQSSIDQSTITGESLPVDVSPGSQVFTGTVNQAGALEIEVTRRASDSTLARIIELVENAREEKAPTQRFLDSFEQKYALGVIAATALAIVVPFFLLNQPFDQVFYRAMTLLVVASPCALVISVPAAVLSAIANAARHGILFKGGAHLENMAAVKAIAFDKTGTLTTGKPDVSDLIPLGSLDETELLALAASVEARSEHPLAQAIVQQARRRGLQFEPCEDFTAISGRGGRAVTADGAAYLVGNAELFGGQAQLPSDVVAQMAVLEHQGKTAMLLGQETAAGLVPLGIVAVADRPRPDARETLETLRRLGIAQIIMLTGDNERVAGTVAGQMGVDQFRAGLLPEEKVVAVQALRAEHLNVAMVGDGVNDAPALAASNVGIAMGAAGTDVALETADVVLMADDLGRIPYVVNLSRRARRIVWQNIAFALGVIVLLVVANFLVGVPLPLGVIGHEGSTLIVVANGLRLLR